MYEYIIPVVGISLIFICTTLGALFVFFFHKKEISNKLNQIFIGFAAGIMVSASFFSLILPALDIDVEYMPNWVIVFISIVLGAFFLWIIDKLVPHFHVASNEEEGIHNHIAKKYKMFLAVTIHNIPEGLSVGIAFGVALASGVDTKSMLMSALFLSIGIGLQNIPEGAVVSLPLKAETKSSTKAFLFGMFSGIVEPIAAIIGLLLAYKIECVMPWALAFAAGSMLYVVVEEMIPESNTNCNNHFGVWAFILGFVIMMALDLISI